jgi:hypothetical protein
MEEHCVCHIHIFVDVLDTYADYNTVFLCASLVPDHSCCVVFLAPAWADMAVQCWVYLTTCLQVNLTTHKWVTVTTREWVTITPEWVTT